MSCRHGSVVTYAISDGGDERMWACADCMIRFYPACRECVDIGHRNEKHVEATLDEACVSLANRLEGRFIEHGDVAALNVASIVRHHAAKAYRETPMIERDESRHCGACDGHGRDEPVPYDIDEERLARAYLAAFYPGDGPRPPEFAIREFVGALAKAYREDAG